MTEKKNILVITETKQSFKGKNKDLEDCSEFFILVISKLWNGWGNIYQMDIKFLLKMIKKNHSGIPLGIFIPGNTVIPESKKAGSKH